MLPRDSILFEPDKIGGVTGQMILVPDSSRFRLTPFFDPLFDNAAEWKVRHIFLTRNLRISFRGPPSGYRSPESCAGAAIYLSFVFVASDCQRTVINLSKLDLPLKPRISVAG